MKHTSFFVILFFWLLCEPSAARTWTSVDGRQIEAKIKKRTKDSVVLLMANGSTHEVKLSQLIAADQEYIKKWIPRRPISVPANAVYHNGSWFALVVEANKKWTQKKAVDKARHMGGRLAQIKDQGTQDVVAKLAKGISAWIDGSDAEVEGLWKWSDGTEFTFSNWFPGEPNNLRRGEHFLLIREKGLWIDAPGSHETAGFIAQWD